ncbi:Ltp family lipoprotein [Arthrobacter sp. SD76]|uniref:Ltp family lipoprotein n=1 Tax=Arthrobacter sp. SD76 TaxID=3415007 RepID=UPI003C77EDC5
MSTGITPPPAPSQPPVGESQKKPLWKKKRFIIPAAIIVFFIIVGACSGGNRQSSTTVDSAPTSTAAPTPADAASQPPTEQPPAEQPPAANEPNGTPAQLQALAAAKGYLSSGIGFSQASLTAQLTSSFGNKFAQADAEWAVANSGADWNDQALKAAKGYLTSGIGFSEASLTKQLTSSAGNQFTPEQAAYAVANSGADWNEQAVRAAKGYMDSGMGFSRERLIDQLTSPFGNQFTPEQAEYAATQVGL